MKRIILTGEIELTGSRNLWMLAGSIIIFLLVLYALSQGNWDYFYGLYR